MRKLRKVFSVCMAVVMLLTALASVSSALTYDPTITGGTIKWSLKADKDTVNPGDTVAISFYVDPGEFNDLGPCQFIISYNGDQLSAATTTNTTFREWQNQAAGFISPTATVNFNLPTTGFSSAMTAEEKAYYNKAIMMGGTVNTGAGVGNIAGMGWTPVADQPQLTFYMKVSDTVQPGEEIWVGFHDSTVVRNMVFLSQAGGNRIPSSNYDMTGTMVKLTVASDEPAGPVVAKSKAEVKMTPNSPTTVEDAFQFRVTSVITDADWDTYFANTAAGGNNAITKLGFVAYKGTDGFDLETAKSVAKGGSAAGYDVATTTYVQKADDSSDAYFGAIIQITSAETRSDATYIAYVEYTDAEGATQYAFYDAAQTALLDTNYQTIVESYLAAYPFAG